MNIHISECNFSLDCTASSARKIGENDRMACIKEGTVTMEAKSAKL